MHNTQIQHSTMACAKHIKNTLLGSITLLGLTLSGHSFGQQNSTATPERWFEIEVILLEQLLDKSRSNEDFNHQKHVGGKKQNIELLSNYLQDISHYGQQLKSCDQQHLSDIKLTSAPSVSQSLISAEIVAQQQQHVINQMTFSAPSSTQSQDSTFNGNKGSRLTIEKQLKQIQINCKQQQFTDLDNAIEKEFYQIPKKISEQEDLYANVPYLLNKESLQLGHLYQSLRRSQQFRPVLHLGWRQAVVNRSQAKPVRLMAGENQTLINDQLSINHDQAVAEISKEQQQRLMSQHIQKIITDINQQNINVTALTKEVASDKPPVIDEQVSNNNPLTLKQDKQVWKIDGLFNVHLDHYLFINSQFNIVNTDSIDPSLVDENSKQQQIIIPFKQNRRVLSGEIHYFDHPYIGMIVQIRRHEKP